MKDKVINELINILVALNNGWRYELTNGRNIEMNDIGFIIDSNTKEVIDMTYSELYEMAETFINQ